MSQNEQSQTNRPTQRLLRQSEVEEILGIKRTTVHVWVKAGKLPAPVRLGARNIAWRDDEIEDWLSTRVRVEASSS